tara:strand:- start:2906 stop:3178 length:273 start_codon:yes stop_codon:yes gene_type:complete
MLHAVIAVGIQLLVGKLTGNWWLPAAAMSALYIGREHAQAEYRWIEHFGYGRRANMPWYGGFQPKAWTLKSLLDWVLPLLATVALALIMG